MKDTPALCGSAAAATFESLLPILNEDFAQLHPILDALELEAGCRLDGETDIRLLHRGLVGSHGWSRVAPQRNFSLEVPLHQPCGRRYGFLGIVRIRDRREDGTGVVLQTMLSAVAGCIAERWFRLSYSDAWILAAAPLADRKKGLLLALDQQLQLQAMDVRATDLLRSRGPATRSKCWEDFFQPIASSPSPRGRVDIPLRLTGARDGSAWSAVLTPPAFSPRQEWTSDELFRARPRCHRLGDLATRDPGPRYQIPKLTPRRRQKIEDFIEANLEVPLSVKQLAQELGMSSAQFSHSFRNTLEMPPHRYVMWRRVLRAQELMRNSNASLSDIALASGFSDQSHLSRHFRNNTGESPAQFRRRCW